MPFHFHPDRVIGDGPVGDADQEWRQREDLLDGLIGAALDAVITVDDKQQIVQFNPAAAAMFRCPEEDAIGQRLDRFIPVRFRVAHHEHIRKFARDGRAAGPMGQGADLAGLRADGEEFPIEASAIHTIQIGGARYYSLFVRDITHSRVREDRLAELHQQSRELASRMRTLQEEERTRIAREIHDELGQLLTAIKMDLRWLAKRAGQIGGDDAREVFTEKLTDATKLVDVMATSVHKIATKLRPPMLDTLGLVEAVGHEAALFEQRSGVRCDMAPASDVVNLPPEVSSAAFRIFQEILTNVGRHAAATKIMVRLERGHEYLTLVVADDGRGISSAALDNRHSLGVLGMRERAGLLGGEVTIIGAPGAGTTVTVTIPLAGHRPGGV